jgi:hypothetical protein
MFFHAVGQMAVDRYPTEGKPEHTPIDVRHLPQGNPTIALFDGLPLANHELLTGRLIIDDPDGWVSDYETQYRKHGTAMASLIAHGDLNESEEPLMRLIYVRPIFKPIRWESIQPIGQNFEGLEGVPKNCLLVDLIHRSVKRLFEGEAEIPPVAPQVTIINLSLGDHARPFIQFTSPLARLLDWLSTKYNVLFIVSAGNCPEDIVFDHREGEFNNLTPVERESETVRFLYSELLNRRLLSPAESINSLTVGALHYDTSTIEQMGRRIDLFSPDSILPSPISAFGCGYRKSVKPDLIFNGGKQLYSIRLTNQGERTALELRQVSQPPGIKVASPGNSPGQLGATIHSCGTSNAAALISRVAGQCYDLLSDIISSNDFDIDDSQKTVLLKAMMVHGCSWGEIGNRIDHILHNSDNISERSNFSKQKQHISRWLGDGVPQIRRIMGCTAQRVTLLGFGELQDDEADVFQFPLPHSLSGVRRRRRLTATLAWLSPIAVSTQRYRIAQLWFELKNRNITNQRQEVDWQMVRRGTVQHEIFEGEDNVPYSDNEVLEIKVNCKKDAGKITSPIAYGLVATLEVSENMNIAIYDEVQSRIAQITSMRAAIVT